MQEPDHSVSRSPQQSSTAGTAGITLGVIGLVGAVVTVAIAYSTTSDPLKPDPTNAFVPIANGINTLFAAAVFIVGGLVSATTSTIGFFLSLARIGGPHQKKGVIGMALCAVGPLLLIGYLRVG